jgi:peroxiredoxin
MKAILPTKPASDRPPMLALQPGDTAPPFEGSPLKGRAVVRLEDYRGQVVCLEFWASWSASCRRSLPWLERLHREHGAAGLEVIGINIDEKPGDALRFLKRYPVGFPVVGDAKGTIATAYNVQDMPTTCLVDRGGILRDVYRAFDHDDMGRRQQAIATLLREPPQAR